MAVNQKVVIVALLSLLIIGLSLYSNQLVTSESGSNAVVEIASSGMATTGAIDTKKSDNEIRSIPCGPPIQRIVRNGPYVGRAGESCKEFMEREIPNFGSVLSPGSCTNNPPYCKEDCFEYKVSSEVTPKCYYSMYRVEDGDKRIYPVFWAIITCSRECHRVIPITE